MSQIRTSSVEKNGMRPHVPPDLLRVVDAVGAHQQVDEVVVVGPARERIRDVGSRELVEHLAAIRLEPGVHAEPERRVRRQRQQVGQEVADLVHQLDEGLTVLDADVHVEAEDEVRPRHQLHVLHDLEVAGIRIDVLLAPVGERMGGAGDEEQPVVLCQAHHRPPQVDDVLTRLANRPAHAGAHLDHGLMHLGLDALVELPLALRHDLGVDVRAEVERLGVECLVFLLDADGERRGHGHQSIDD